MSDFSLGEYLSMFLDQLFQRHPYLVGWVTGVVGWFFATLIWEGLIKAQRARRGLAFMLLSEVNHNIERANGAVQSLAEHPHSIPLNLQFSRVAFSALTSRLSELPRAIIPRTITYYALLEQIDRQVEISRELTLRLEEVAPDPSRYPGPIIDGLNAAIKSNMNVYRRYLTDLAVMGAALQPELRRASILLGKYRVPKDAVEFIEIGPPESPDEQS